MKPEHVELLRAQLMRTRAGQRMAEAGTFDVQRIGFPAHGATDADVVRWAKWWSAIQAEPLLGHASPFVGGAIFQVGNREDWSGYNVEGHIDALAREVWR